MQKLTTTHMESLSGGETKNCGSTVETAVVIQTCSLAGGLIGLAFGPIGASVGSLAGGAACHLLCDHV